MVVGSVTRGCQVVVIGAGPGGYVAAIRLAQLGKDVLLFSTPDNPGKTRVKMTVWASFDRGKTWPVKRLINESHSAYSSLAAGKNGIIYLLFERGEKKLYDRMAVARFNLAWLAEGKDLKSLLSDDN